MKFLYITPEAISQLVIGRYYQSNEYNEGGKLVELLQGKIDSFEDGFVHTIKMDEGLILYSGHLNRQAGLFFDYDQFCSFKEETPDRIITIFQKVLRFAIRYFGGRNLAQCELVKDNMGIVFPFPYTDRGESYRVVLDRNTYRKGKTLNFLTVYYGGTGEASPNPKFNNLETFYANFRNLESPSPIVVEQVDNNKINGLNVSELGDVGRCLYTGLTFDDWFQYLTEPQKQFINREVVGAERLEGAAGTGKTLSMVLKCLKVLKISNFSKRVVFITHSVATKNHIIDLFEECSPGIKENMYTDGSLKGKLLVTTVQEWCIKYLGTNLADTEYLDRDAMTSKNLQKMYIQEALHKVNEEYFEFYKTAMSPEYHDFISNSEEEILLDMLQYEIGVVIKGKANGELELYKSLSRPNYGIPCVSDVDFLYTHLIYSDYQQQLCLENTFDSDDIVITALSSLNAPIWRRRREQEGFDACFIDETHLFNFNELSVFPFLNKSEACNNIIFAIDKSQFGGEILERAEDVFAMTEGVNKPVEERFKTIFRSSPDIINLACNIMSVGSGLYTNFDNPLLNSCYLGDENNPKSKYPEYCLTRGENEMVISAVECVEWLHRELKVSRAECCLIPMSDVLSEQIKKYCKQINKPIETIISRGDVSAKERALKGNKIVMAGIDYVGGLEFDYAILVGVDDSRVPPKSSQKKHDFHFVNYAWHNKIYVALTRARFGVYMFGDKTHGLSTMFENAIKNNLLTLK